MPVPLILAMLDQFVRQASSMEATLVVVQADTLAPNATLTSTNVTKDHLASTAVLVSTNQDHIGAIVQKVSRADDAKSTSTNVKRIPAKIKEPVLTKGEDSDAFVCLGTMELIASTTLTNVASTLARTAASVPIKSTATNAVVRSVLQVLIVKKSSTIG